MKRINPKVFAVRMHCVTQAIETSDLYFRPLAIRAMKREIFIFASISIYLPFESAFSFAVFSVLDFALAVVAIKWLEYVRYVRISMLECK